MTRLHWWRDGRENLLRLSRLLLVISAWSRRFFFAFCLHKLKVHDGNQLLLDDVLGLNNFHRLDLHESALFQLHTGGLCLLDAWRESAEAPTIRLQCFHNVINSEKRRGKIEEHSISDTIQLFCEAIAANISMLNCDKVPQSMLHELFPRSLNSILVEVKCVQMSSLFDSSEEVVGK